MAKLLTDDEVFGGAAGSGLLFDDEVFGAKKPDEKPPGDRPYLLKAVSNIGGHLDRMAGGVLQTIGGVGSVLQAPGESARSMLLGGLASADRLVASGLNAIGPEGTQVTPNATIQAAAQTAAADAVAQRRKNIDIENDSALVSPRTLLARIGGFLQEDSRDRIAQNNASIEKNYPEMVAAEREVAQAEGFGGKLAAMAQNPMGVTSMLAQSAPAMALGVGASATVARSTMGAAGKAADLAVARVAAAGGDAAAQTAAAKAAIDAVGKTAVARASTVGMASEAITQGEQGRESIYQEVMNLPADKLMQSPRYRQLLAANRDPMAARETLANEVADQTVALSAGGTALGSKLTNRMFGGDTTAKAVAGVERLAARDVAKNTLQEGVEEGLQAIPQTLAEHAAKVQADPSAKMDMGGALAENMVAGHLMGGAGTGARYTGQRIQDYRQTNGKKSAGDQQAPAAAPAGQDAAPVSADEVLGVEPAPAAAPVVSDAEKALLQPRMLTTLDRVVEIDAALPTAPEADREALQVERANLTKDWPAAVPGASTTFSTEAGARLGAQYALMEVGELQTSHDEDLRRNPVYPQELQPRERDRAASEMQVQQITQKLDPARLGLSADSANGAPIVGADGLVESGNARTIALKRIYKVPGQKASEYRGWLRENAAQFGLQPEQVDGMTAPVLVRVRTTPVNRAEFARQANASTVAAMSPVEQARSDAKRIDDMGDLTPDDNGDFATSRDFIRRFMARMPITEQGGMVDADGRLSSTGYARVRNAVLAKAYGDSPILTRMVESMDDSMRNLSKALMIAAPRVARAREAIGAGALFDADITPHLVEAAQELGRLKDAGTSVQDALAQVGLMGDTYSPETREMLQFLSDNARRPRRMAEFVGAYFDALEAAGDPRQGGMFGEPEAPAKTDLMTAARRETEGAQDAAIPAQDTQRGVDREAAPAGEGPGQQSAPAQGDQVGARGDGAAGAAAEGWEFFGPETGTLGIPRAEMPQVKGEHRGALINFLEARGIGHENDVVPASSLKPTQAEYSRGKVDKFVESGAIGARSVMVSSDGHVLDGHHQWLGHAERGEDIPVIRLDAPIRELLDAVNAFPSVRRSNGSSAARDQVRADFKNALADLAQIASRHTRAAMVKESTPDLMPTLIRLFEAGVKEVGYSMKDLLAYVKTSIKNDPALKTFWNKISGEMYRKAARQAIDNLPPMAMIDGRPYNPKRDNFQAPSVADFMDAEILKRADGYVERYYKDRPPVPLSAEDRAKAEQLLAPLLEKAAADKVEYDQKIIDIALRTKAIGQMIAPIKGMKRAAEKLALEEGFNLSGMKDLLRSTIVVSSYADAQQVLSEIEKEFQLLRKPKNRTNDFPMISRGEPLPADDMRAKDGYTDVLVNVVMPSGVIAEIQINVPEMLAAKEGQGHKLYEAYREAPKESPLGQEIMRSMRGFYVAAFDAAAARHAATELKNAASSELNRDDARGNPLGTNDAPSSEIPNTLPSGNFTRSSPPNESKNSQPGGNLSGTFIASSPDTTVSQNQESVHNTGTGGDPNATSNGRKGPAGKGPKAPRGPGKGGNAGPVRDGSDQLDFFGDRDLGDGGEGPGQVGPVGPDGVRPKDEGPGKPGNRKSTGPDAGVPAGRDIPAKRGLNYRFGEGDLTYKGSWLVKAAANVDAVELLKKLQTEKRQATPEEQKILARFIGWGASELANNLFSDKLDEKARTLDAYDRAVEGFEKRGNAPMRIDPYSRWQGAPQGYYDALSVLRAADKNFPTWGSPEITREALDKARPPAEVRRWVELRDRLKDALTPEEWKAASRSTQYAHYTSKAIVSSMWRALDRFGFKGGTVLEPGAGIGIFAGLMPEATAFNSSYTGIEFDPITGGILQQLFPDERILVESFIDTKLPKNFYDVAIGNPPFSGTPILADPEYRKLGLKLHDYFFAKTIDRIKPGGLVMFVTSRYTMDKLDDKARAYLAERADLVGAIRLPQTAFKQNAGTDVVTDVLFLRKKVDGETFPHAQPWAKSVPMKVGGSTFPVNEYFHAHPEMVLGLHSDTGKMQNSSEPQYTVLATAGDIEERFAKAVEGLPADIYKPEQGTAAEAAKAREIDFNPKAKKEGNYYLSDAGVLMQREGGQGHRVDGMSAKQVEIIKAAVPLRDALKQAQYDQLNDGDWQSSLAALKKAYKAFVAKHGQVNQFTSRTVKVKIDELDEDGNPTGQKIDDEEVRRTFPILRAIKDDPDWTLLAALENFNEDTGAISESRFLSERTLGKASKPVIETPHDAMLASLNDLGRIDIDDIARRIGLSNDVVIDALGSSVFNDPEAGWVTDDAYLSGNVRRKLDIARAAAKADRKFERNVSALEAAQPAPLVPSQIDAEIGQNWIEGSDYAQFLQETAGVEARIIFNSATRQWKVDVIRGQASMGAIADWGTVDRNAADILEASLSGRPIKVMRTQGSGSNRTTVFDKVATESALEKQGKLRQEFKSWLWRDAERTARLVQKYNDQFNTDVPRKFDGRHLTMPGMSMLTDTFDHVKRGAWRIIQTGNTYLAHAVGSGKTRQMVISAMEQKRLGLIKKPMVIVPNHMLKQFAREWQELYPAARLMVADEAEFHTDNRRRFVSRVALSDLDAVIMTHSSFKLLDLDPAYKAKLIDEQLEFMRAALEEAKASDDTGRSIRVKQIEKRIEAMEDRLKAMADKGSKDANVRFDEMGVDMLYVDEAHEFRKLEFATSRQMKGIQPSGSERAMDLYMKVRWLDEKNPGRSLVMASGTPITNTVAEFYSVQRFMDPNTLEARGMQDFDSWASMFGRPKTALESTAAGKYEPVTRFGEFANVGDMTRMFRRFADVVTADDLAAMLGDRRPKLEGGERVAVMAPKSAAYEAYRKTLEMRMKISRDWKPSKDSPTNPDPMVKIIGDGRLAAIDMRFVDPEAESDPKSKLNLMIDDVIAAYKAGADVEFTKDGKVVPGRGNTMMVFSDLGFGKGVTERRGFNARAWFEKRLRDAGVAPNHVAFMSDYKKSSAKADLFRDMNNGKVRILVGSSKNMGTGVNAQQRLRTLFHLDSPWYPSDLEQREGRIIRAGNMNKTVEVRAYSTKGTYDEVMWKMLANKQRFINQALSGDASVRRIEDLDSQSDFEILSALVAEDPRIMQMAGLQGDIARLERLYVAHEDQRMRFIRETRDAKATIDGNARAMATAEAAAAMVQDLKGDAFVAKAGKATFKERAAWGEALLAAYRDMTARKDATQKIGEISGFDIILVSRLGSTYEARVDLRLPTGAYTLINDGSESPVGMAVRATGALAEVTRWPARLREESKAAAAKIDALSTRLNATFSGQEELASKRQELAEIERQLAAEALAKDKPVEPKDDDPAAGTNLSRGAGGGIALPALKAVAGRISKAMPGLPKVHVLASPAQAPEALRKFIEERGAMGDAEGAFHAGEIYLFASGISDETRAEHVLAEHEAAHAGLAGLLGNGKARAMQAIANQNPAVRKAATARVAQGVSLAEAVEEVLVDIPSRDLARLKGWRALVGKVRDAFKAGGFDRLAAQIDRWLAGHLTEQQKADLFVADLVREARGVMRRPPAPANARERPLTPALSDGKLSDDLAAQEAWLTREAKGRGYEVRFTESEAALLFKDGKEQDYRDMPPDVRNAWNVLSLDEGEQWTEDTKFSQARKPQTETAAFKTWFGDSKVVDADGNPRVMYHGTASDISKFDHGKRSSSAGFYFTDQPAKASMYAAARAMDGGRGANVMPVYLKMENPKRVDFAFDSVADEAKAQGHDGLITRNEFVVFSPEQIKSATGNSGAFDATNPDIRLSRAATPAGVGQVPAQQEAWLTREAKGRGYKDIEDLLERNYPLFEKLAALWRQKNPASALLSRAAQSFKPVDVTSESFKRWFGASMIKTSPKMSASARPAVERRLHEAERFIASYSSDIKARQDALRDAEPARASWLSQDIARLEKTRAHYFDVATRERAALATAPEYDGTPVPRVMYHATVSDFSTFKVGKEGAIYLASSPADARKVAEFKFHEGGYLKDEFGIRVPLVESLQILPLYVRAENPWDPSNEAHVAGMVAALEASGEKLPKRSFSLEETGMTFTLRDRVVDGEWEIIESAPAQAYIRSQGHDGFWAKEKDEDGGMNLAVYSANQVKSAISNTGDFSTTNDDIRMSRAAVAGSAPAKTATERAEAIIQNAAGTPKPLDAVAKLLTRVTGIEKVARVFYGLGGRLIDRLTPETVKAGIVSDYGVPEAVIDQRAMMQGRQREQLRQAGALLSKLTTMTRAESRVAYEWMNMEGTDDPRAYVSMMQGLPEESVRVLQEVQGLIDSLSKEAVRLGQLDPEAFKRHRFAYLRRSYYKHAAEMQEGDKAKRQRVISIVGEQYKGRGMVAKAAMRQIQNIAPEWWQRKMVAGKADTALKGEKFIRLEKCAATGEKTTPLDGMEGKARGRILEIAYWPAGEKVPARFADWDNAGTWEVRDVKGADAVMWSDFTKEKREKMGEIDEARYAIAKTLHGMIHDVEVGRYLEWLAKEHALKEGQEIPGVVVEASERYKDTFKPGEWVQVPESQIKGTSVQKYGLLAGRYVPGPIWNDLRQVVGGRFQPLGETYDKILKMWKASKTALSPAVHMNNVMSNFVMADWHDVSAGHVQKALRILLGALERDGAGAIGRAGNLAARLGIGDREAAQAILTRYQDSGGAIGGWLTQEIANDQLEPIVEALKAEIELKAADAGGGEVGVYSALQHLLHARFGAAWEAAKGSKPGQAIGTEGKNLLALYSSEDDVFRLAAWLKAKEEGKTDLEAGKVSRRSFLDYSINAPWVQAARQTALPFISFTYRALPMLLHTAGTKPHKLMKLMALAGALNWLGVMLGGGGDDRERKMLPEEKAGRVWGLVPKLIRMPWNDKHGSPVYLDIRRWIPVGDVADLGQGHSALPIPPSLMPGGPLAVALEVVFNRSMFTGKAIALDTDTVTEHAKKLADHLWKAAMPNVAFIPGTYAWSGISDSLSGRTDTFGRDLSPGMAAANTVGVKLGAYPVDVLRRNLMGKANAEIMEIEKNVADLKRQRRTNRITAEELSEGIRAQMAKENKVRRELAEKMR